MRPGDRSEAVRLVTVAQQAQESEDERLFEPDRQGIGNYDLMAHGFPDPIDEVVVQRPTPGDQDGLPGFPGSRHGNLDRNVLAYGCE